MVKTLCVVAAHPDDEVLGCGATVRKFVDAGWRAVCILMTGGISGRHASGAADAALLADQERLAAQSASAAAVLGFARVDRLDFPDNRMDTVSRMDVSHVIRQVLDEERPDLILTHHAGDYNWDHTITFDAVLMAARHSPGDPSPAEIWSFEVRSSTERGWAGHLPFAPTIYVDVGATLAIKEDALRCYEAELHAAPHPRSVGGIRALATMRGHEVGMDAAEAFACVRRVIA
jgi:LmbE family N-acetylglucosaminyl deacetylase